MRRGFRRVDNCHVRWSHAPQQRLEQRIVRAAQHQHVGIVKSVAERLGQINARNLLGDGMLSPTLFYQWNQQRARLLVGLESARQKRRAPASKTATC